jgi:hypothetical protein
MQIPNPTLQRFLLLLCAAATSLAATGCSASLFTDNPRINHLNSPAREKAAAKGVAALAEFSDSAKGLSPLLLQNLRAEMALAGTVSAAQVQLDEQRRPGEAAMSSWSEVRRKFFENLGITTGTNPSEQFRIAISRRIATVRQVADVLVLLRDAEAAVAEKKQKRIDELTSKIGAAPARGPPPSRSRRRTT